MAWTRQSKSSRSCSVGLVSNQEESFGSGVFFESGELHTSRSNVSGFYFDLPQREPGFELVVNIAKLFRLRSNILKTPEGLRYRGRLGGNSPHACGCDSNRSTEPITVGFLR